MILPSDFNITGQSIPQSVVDKIVEYHLIDLWEVEAAVPFDIFVSKNSGYRPKWYEQEMGRLGNSQHTFSGKGAVDLSCHDFINNKDRLLAALVTYSKYTRIADYGTFFHCDFKTKERWLYNSQWKRIKRL